jgi:hypothetical protein
MGTQKDTLLAQGEPIDTENTDTEEEQAVPEQIGYINGLDFLNGLIVSFDSENYAYMDFLRSFIPHMKDAFMSLPKSQAERYTKELKAIKQRSAATSLILALNDPESISPEEVTKRYNDLRIACGGDWELVANTLADVR